MMISTAILQVRQGYGPCKANGVAGLNVTSGTDYLSLHPGLRFPNIQVPRLAPAAVHDLVACCGCQTMHDIIPAMRGTCLNSNRIANPAIVKL